MRRVVAKSKLTLGVVALVAGIASAVSVGVASAGSSDPSTLNGGATLTSGQTLESGDGQYALEMESNGNLEEHRTSGTQALVWSSGTSGTGNSATVQSNGELAVDGPNGEALWTDNMPTSGCAALNVLGNGDVEVDNASGAAWDSGAVSHLADGDALLAGQDIYSPSRFFALEMQGDGNLVLYNSAGDALWASGTAGNPGAYTDIASGNFDVFSSTGQVLWSAGTGSGGDQLDPQDDGNLVLYNSSSGVLWTSGTRSSSANTGQIKVLPAPQLGSASPCPASSTTPTVTVTAPTSTQVTVAAPPPTTTKQKALSIPVAFDWTWKGGYSYVEKIVSARLPAGVTWTATITSPRRTRHGITTSRASLTARNAGQRQRLIAWLKHHRYAPGETVIFTISRPGYRAQTNRFTIRLHHTPSVSGTVVKASPRPGKSR